MLTFRIHMFLSIRKQRLTEKLGRWLAWHFPHFIVHWCGIRILAYATMGKYSNTNPSEMDIMTALNRWDLG